MPEANFDPFDGCRGLRRLRPRSWGRSWGLEQGPRLEKLIDTAMRSQAANDEDKPDA